MHHILVGAGRSGASPRWLARDFKVTLEKLATYPDVTVRFDTRMTELRQTADQVMATLGHAGERRPLAIDYVIAADGGRSTVRRALSSDFEGVTFPERFVVITVLDDFEKLLGCSYRSYLAAPREWGNLFKVSVGRRREDASVFDRYDRRHRTLNIEFVQQQTIANKKRLGEQDPLRREAAMDELRATVDDPVRHKQFLMRSSLLDSVRRPKPIDGNLWIALSR